MVPLTITSLNEEDEIIKSVINLTFFNVSFDKSSDDASHRGSLDLLDPFVNFVLLRGIYRTCLGLKFKAVMVVFTDIDNSKIWGI